MPSPRYPRKETVRIETPDTDGTPIAEKVLAIVASSGYRTLRSAVYAGKMLVVRVAAGIGARVQLDFPNVNEQRMSNDIHAAQRGEIRPLMIGDVTENAEGKTGNELRDHRRLHVVGCRVLCSSPDDAVDIITEVAKRVFGGMG